jgi:hypothetical protein
MCCRCVLVCAEIQTRRFGLPITYWSLDHATDALLAFLIPTRMPMFHQCEKMRLVQFILFVWRAIRGAREI